jgi:glycosyltransferase involved in cell wall biosynthesis
LLDCGKPIVTWTDAVFHSMNDYYSKAFANMTHSAVRRGKWQEETALRNCSVAAYASTWALEGARRLTGAGKLKVLPFGSSLPVNHDAEDIARFAAEKRATRGRRCELLFVGVNWERKGGAIAVETARLLNEAGIETRLRVVGSQPEGEAPKFVEALGFINKSSETGLQKLIQLFRSADFFILPTKAEAAGIVFSEASSYGLPSLTYATGGVTDYVRSGVNGVCIEAGAPATRFAAEIEKIHATPGEYQRYAVGAFEEYRNRLNWESSVRQLIQICNECG